MVDYKLIIDIDEHELVKKLKRALSQVGGEGGGSFGGGTPYMAHMGGLGRTAGAGGVGATLTEAGMKRVAETVEKREVYHRSKMNLLTFEASKKAEFQKQKHGDRMEAMGKMQHKMQSKMFTSGTIVKLAGLATGVAGLMQMRKMIIDSSPMLQAMLKIMNVAVMFTLRPIGDFIGYVLRPLLIPFLKMAVLWYRSRLPLVIEEGGKLGDAIIEGDIVGVLEGIQNAILILHPGISTEDLEQRLKDSADEAAAWRKFFTTPTGENRPEGTVDISGDERVRVTCSLRNA